MRNLEARLSPIVHAAFNEEMTKRTVGGVLSTERDKVDAGRARPRSADDAKSFGIDVLDVRIKRVDFVAQHHRVDLQPDGARSASRSPTSCARPAPPRARRSAPTPTASAR